MYIFVGCGSAVSAGRWRLLRGPLLRGDCALAVREPSVLFKALAFGAYVVQCDESHRAQATSGFLLYKMHERRPRKHPSACVGRMRWETAAKGLVGPGEQHRNDLS